MASFADYPIAGIFETDALSVAISGIQEINSMNEVVCIEHRS